MNETSLESEIKEVYANFGLAIYQAQCLEHGLVNAMLFIELLPRRLDLATSQEQWEPIVEAFTESKFKLTLGRMINALASVSPVDSSLHEQLSKALEKRNWLAHHYFRDRAETFLTSRGRASMVAELEDAQVLFSAADSALEAATKPARLKAGLTDEMLAQTYANLRVQVGD